MPKNNSITTSQQPLFNADLEPIRYLVENASYELTFDGKLRTFWASQKLIAEMLDISVQSVNPIIQNYKKANADIIDSLVKVFLITASDGKTYKVEHYSLDIIIYVGYRAQVTERTTQFQRWATGVIRQYVEDGHARAMHKAQHARAGDVTHYILGGMSQEHAAKRVDLKDTFKQLSALIIRISDVKLIGQVVSKEYVILFGVFAKDLKRILHSESIRDALPELQMDYLQMVERTLIVVLSQKDRISEDEMMKLTIKTITPLAEHLRMICELAQIDIVTGRKTLGGGK